MDQKQLSVVTVATAFSDYIAQFFESCRRHGVAPITLGFGIRPTGYGLKIKLVHEALKTLKHLSKHILLVDAFDSVFVHGLDTIFYRYKAFQHPWVCSTEKNCFPSKENKDRYPESPTPYRFLNSGGWIGETQYIFDLYEKTKMYEVPESINDQLTFSLLFLDRPGTIKLDYRCEIFQTLLKSMDDLEYADGIRNKLTGTYPSVIHGNHDEDMTQVMKWCGLGTGKIIAPVLKNPGKG